MDVRVFRNFLVVAEELHVGRAAERLGIAQPALSQQIKALEAWADVRLFVRANRRISLTEAGEAFLREIDKSVRHTDEALRLAQRTARGEIGKIVIGYVSSATLTSAFSEVLSAFRKSAPEVEIEMRQLVLAEHLESLREQLLDVAVLRGPLPVLPEGFEHFTLIRQPILVALPEMHAAAKEKEVALASLSAESFIMLEDPRGSGYAHSAKSLFEAAGFEPKRGLVVNEMATIVSLVAAGLGLALVPVSEALKHIPGVAYRPLSDVEGQSDLLVVHRRFERSAAVRALLTCFRASCRPIGPAGTRF